MRPKKKTPQVDTPIDPRASLAEQLRQAIARSEMRPSHIAERLGVPASSITRFVRREKEISLATASALSELLHLGWVESDGTAITPEDVLPDRGD